MATLTDLTLTGDATIGGAVQHDAGSTPPFYTHCNDDPDSSSSDWVSNNTSNTTTQAWFSLSDVDSDFSSMDTLGIRVEKEAQFVPGGAGSCTAQIYDADNDTTNPLTDRQTVATTADGIKNTANFSFGSLAGTKAQWDDAYIVFTWSGLANGQTFRIYGTNITGTYTQGAGGACPVEGPYVYDNLQFAANSFDINSSSTEANDITIQATNTANPATAISGNVDSTITIENTVQLTLTDIVVGSEVRIYKTGKNPPEELAGIETEDDGTFVYNYNYTGDFSADIVVVNNDYVYFRQNDNILTASPNTIKINQVFDRNYENPS